MRTVSVQVRLPKRIAEELDRWVAKKVFMSRSDAVRSIITFYDERQKTIAFYNMLVKRSEESKRNPEELVPLDDVS